MRVKLFIAPAVFLLTVSRRFNCRSSCLCVCCFKRVFFLNYLFLISPSFCESGELCFIIVPFPGCLVYITKTHLYKYIGNFTTKTENFQLKHCDSFYISAQNINCGYVLEPPRRGGSNEYPQSMFLSRNVKINVYPM